MSKCNVSQHLDGVEEKLLNKNKHNFQFRNF